MEALFTEDLVNNCDWKKKKKKNVGAQTRNPNTYYVTVWIQLFLLNPAERFPFFFCFHTFQGGRRQILLFMRQILLFIHCSGTIYILFMRPTVTLLKKILKIDLIILFTHLKIILLPCFQFLVSTPINSIQSKPI